MRPTEIKALGIPKGKAMALAVEAIKIAAKNDIPQEPAPYRKWGDNMEPGVIWPSSSTHIIRLRFKSPDRAGLLI